MKKRRLKRNDYACFCCETTLPPDAAMQRIQALESMSRSISARYSETYQIAHEKLDDNIYFEVRMLTQYEWMPRVLSRVVNGQIRQLAPARTLVQSEVVTPPRVRTVGIALVAIVGATAILLYLSGNMPESELVKIVGIVIVGTILFHIFKSSNLGRHPIIHAIETRIQSSEDGLFTTARHEPDEADGVANVSAGSTPIKPRQECG